MYQQEEENTDARREGKRGECVLDTDITVALQKQRILGMTVFREEGRIQRG